MTIFSFDYLLTQLVWRGINDFNTYFTSFSGLFVQYFLVHPKNIILPLLNCPSMAKQGAGFSPSYASYDRTVPGL
jgi:hypothetical protein